MASWSRALLSTSLVLFACGDDKGGSTTAASTTASTDAATSDATTAGSTGDVPTTGASTGAAAGRPNWHEDIAPLVATNCLSCHAAGGIAPFSMETYALASPWAPVMADDIDAGTMPPWHALETDLCAPPFPFKHDARLTADEQQLFRAWADAGAPEGDPALAAPLPDPQSLDLPNPTKTVAMSSSLSIDSVGSTRDFFHCISLDPANAETVYLDGVQVVPGNRKIVHHVLIYADPTGASAGWQGGVKQNCGGGSGIQAETQLIGGWVPGGMPMEAPKDVATELPPGTRLILNVHYHATGGGPETDDGTGLALRWSTTKPAWGTLFALIGAPGVGKSLTGPLMVPAGEKDHVEDYEFTVSMNGQSFPDALDVRLWSLTNHMHKVGVDMRAWVVDRDTGAETCLIQTPRWDFNWQRSYAYDTPITGSVRVRYGDKLRIRCIYDNTLDNPGVVEALAEVGLDAPIDVQLGEATLDEMCLLGVGVAIKGL